MTAIRESPSSPWVQFPTEMATQAQQQFTQQYSQQTILASSNLGSPDILIGFDAEQALAERGAPAEPAEGGAGPTS